MQAFAIKSSKIITSDGIKSGYIGIENGKITSVTGSRPGDRSQDIHDYGDWLVMPGIVDTHVHVNEPGRTDWEGFDSATKAAAAGGITTVIDMPLNCSPVTTSLAALIQKKEAVKEKLWIDCGFHGGIVPGNQDQIAPMIAAGIRSFKAFLVFSGIDEFPEVTERDLDLVLPTLAKSSIPLLLHAELVDSRVQVPDQKDPSSYQQFLATRPDSWEIDAVRLAIDLSKRHRCQVHIVHLSSAEAIVHLHAARKAGVQISAETCPHYLTIEAEEIPDGNSLYKCAPPIRSLANQQRLWTALRNGDVDFIVSDHSPCTPALKRLAERDIRGAWGGISSLQFGLSLIWTRGQEYQISPVELARWMCSKPAELVGLQRKKGSISVGFDADFAIWDPNAESTICAETTLHRHKQTPYENRRVKGRNMVTYLRGQKVYECDKIVGTQQGEFL
jgi:allantoinase